jgi:hypothetical protein
MSKSDHSELVKILIKSTAVYILSSLDNKHDKEVYSKAVQMCLSCCENGSNLNDWLLNVKLSKSKSAHIVNNKGLFACPKKSYELAHDHAIDIIENIKLSFETGGSSADSVFLSSMKDIK